MRFVEWNTMANGLGIGYDPNDPALISASQPSSPTTLYAIWATVAYYTITVTVNPPEGITDYDGDGTYPESTNAHFIHWDVAPGYYITSVYDNGVLVDPIKYSGDKLQFHKIDMDHDVIINLAPTSYTLTYNGNGGTYSGGTTSSSTLAIGASYVCARELLYKHRVLLHRLEHDLRRSGGSRLTHRARPIICPLRT